MDKFDRLQYDKKEQLRTEKVGKLQEDTKEGMEQNTEVVKRLSEGTGQPCCNFETHTACLYLEKLSLSVSDPISKVSI